MPLLAWPRARADVLASAPIDRLLDVLRRFGNQPVDLAGGMLRDPNGIHRTGATALRRYGASNAMSGYPRRRRPRLDALTPEIPRV